jgi:polysaccharide biosynthesis transport protein
MQNSTPHVPHTGFISSAAQVQALDNTHEVPLLLQYWHVVLRRRYIILTIIGAFLFTGLVVNLLITPQYAATVRLEISRQIKHITKADNLESEQASSNADLEFYQTQYSLLKARTIAERVARGLKLAEDPSFFKAHGATAAGSGYFTSSSASSFVNAKDRERRERQVVDLLESNINIAPVRSSSLVDVTYSSASPELSARIANYWTQQYIADSVDRRFSATADARKFLEDRLGELKGRVEGSEKDVANYATAHNIVVLNKTSDANGQTVAQTTMVASNLTSLNDSLNKATAARIEAEARMRSFRSGESSDALQNTGLSTLKEKRAEMQAEYAKLLVQFQPSYPAAKALAGQVQDLNASIGREEQRIAASTRAQYEAAVKNENDLRSKVNAIRGQLDQQSRDSIQYNIYQRDADTNKQLYDSLLQRYKAIGASAIDANNISIVDAALVPNKASSPRIMLNLLFSLLAGLATSVLVVLGMEQLDEGVREPWQVPKDLHIPLLGNTPLFEATSLLDIVNDPKSNFSESGLSLHSSLSFSTDHGFPHSLLLTSTRPKEGKSTSSILLAAVRGRMGKKVLLVDGDMRAPSLSKILGVSSATGLSNYLAGDDAWQKSVINSGLKGVDFLSSGPIPPNAAELLSTERIMQFVAAATERYDSVIIDGPPMLGLADTPLLVRAVEGCMYLIQIESTKLRGIKNALNRLHEAQARIFGAVITKMSLQQVNYGYGYGYGYGYEAGYGYGYGHEASSHVED